MVPQYQSQWLRTISVYGFVRPRGMIDGEVPVGHWYQVRSSCRAAYRQAAHCRRAQVPDRKGRRGWEGSAACVFPRIFRLVPATTLRVTSVAADPGAWEASPKVPLKACHSHIPKALGPAEDFSKRFYGRTLITFSSSQSSCTHVIFNLLWCHFKRSSAYHCGAFDSASNQHPLPSEQPHRLGT